MPLPLGFAPSVIPPPLPIRGQVRFTHVVQAGFGTLPPADPNPTVTTPGHLNLGGWTTLSTVSGDPVRACTATRTSVNDSSGEAEQGTAKIILYGDNGWLDPTNPFGPYHGYLVPSVPIRVLITDGLGNYWPSWRGFVSDWPVSQGSKTIQDAEIDCYDSLGWLAVAAPLFPTELHRATLASGPVAYWPHDTSGAATIRELIAGYDATASGGAVFDGPALTVEGLGSSLQAIDMDQSVAMPSTGAMFPTGEFTVAMLLSVQAAGSPGSPVGYLDAVGGSTDIQVNSVGVAISSGGVRESFWDGGSGGAVLGVGGPYYLTMTWDAAGNLVAMVNGVVAQSTTGAVLTINPITTLRWGTIGAAGGTTGQASQISHVTVWNRSLPQSEAAALSAAAIVGRAGETADQRVGYLLDRAGWPAALRSLPTCVVPLGPVRMSAGDATLDLIRNAAQFEDGMVGCAADGSIFLLPRFLTPPATGFHIGGSAAPKQNPVYSFDDATVVTSAAVSDPAVVFDSGAQLVNGRSISIPQLAFKPDQAWQVAQRKVQLGSVPRMKINQVTLDPVDVPSALTMDLGQVGTVIRRPIWSPTDITEVMQIVSVTDDGGAAKSMTRTFTMLAPQIQQVTLECTFIPPTGATAAHLARFDPAATMVIEVQANVEWASPGQCLVSHGDPTVSGFGATGWAFRFDPSGLLFDWADALGVAREAKSLPLIRTGNRYIWMKTIFTIATGTASFWVSTTNRDSYIAWGAGGPGGSTYGLSAAGINVGMLGASGQPLNGYILKAYVYTLAGTVMATFDPTADDQPPAGTFPTSAPWTSSSGEVWTVNTFGALVLT